MFKIIQHNMQNLNNRVQILLKYLALSVASFKSFKKNKSLIHKISFK